jgi:hypothetical protein
LWAALMMKTRGMTENISKMQAGTTPRYKKIQERFFQYDILLSEYILNNDKGLIFYYICKAEDVHE